MSNFVFSRRAMQQAINRLAVVLRPDQLASIVDRLNRPGSARLPAMWELIMLDAMAGIGALRHEIKLPNGRCPDIELAVTRPQGDPLLIVGDVVTISDAGLDKRNPVQALSAELSRLAVKAELDPKHFGYDVRGEQVGSYGDSRMNLFLPVEGELLELMRREVAPWVCRLKVAPQQADRFDYAEGKIAFSLTYNPQQVYAQGSYPIYDVAASRDKNPLVNALKDKVRQLRQAPAEAIRLIIVCDGDSALLRKSALMHSPGTFSPRDVAENFLRQNSSIDAILLVTINEQHQVLAATTTYRMKYDLVITPQSAKSKRMTSDVIAAIETIMRSATERVPLPTKSAYNAVIRCREPGFGPDMIGGYIMRDNRVSLSSRVIQRLLAGEMTIDEFIAAHGWKNGSGRDNPFTSMMRSGRMIAAIEVESAGDKDDDWLDFRFGPPDPAVAPFHVPSSVQPELAVANQFVKRSGDLRAGIGANTPMPKGLGSTIVKLLIASLLVGLVMHWFGVTLRSLIANFGATIQRMFDSLVSFVGWAFDYILVGAVIVVPVWLVVFLLDRVKQKRGF